MTHTTNPNDPNLHEKDEVSGQNKSYMVLSDEERKKGFIRPFRNKYVHKCGIETKMSDPISETYARDPKFYGSTWCMGCRAHLPVAEFTWSQDGTILGS